MTAKIKDYRILSECRPRLCRSSMITLFRFRRGQFGHLKIFTFICIFPMRASLECSINFITITQFNRDRQISIYWSVAWDTLEKCNQITALTTADIGLTFPSLSIPVIAAGFRNSPTCKVDNRIFLSITDIFYEFRTLPSKAIEYFSLLSFHW